MTTLLHKSSQLGVSWVLVLRSVKHHLQPGIGNMTLVWVCMAAEKDCWGVAPLHRCHHQWQLFHRLDPKRSRLSRARLGQREIRGGFWTRRSCDPHPPPWRDVVLALAEISQRVLVFMAVFLSFLTKKGLQNINSQSMHIKFDRNQKPTSKESIWIQHALTTVRNVMGAHAPAPGNRMPCKNRNSRNSGLYSLCQATKCLTPPWLPMQGCTVNAVWFSE
mmetsp:Transcript_78173/g.137998  ORF Transcript_78173/g.137998 Transcript_78173/m.137998 type:complete len:219 (+) Transcript_78173:32-688(+)